MMGKLRTTLRRWLGGSAAMLALGMLSGCNPLYLSKEVYEQAHCKDAMLPPRLEEDRCPIPGPISAKITAPPTVNAPDRRPRHLTLQEALALALENGAPSGRTLEGRADTTLASFNGPGSLNNQTDRIRVLALNPAIQSSAIEASLARFDAVWVSAMNWTNTDNLQQGLSSFSNGHGANFNSSIVKAFAGGGVASVSGIVNYQNLNDPPAGVTNPLYTTRLSFAIDKPLWRDAGVDINQLLPRLSTITGQSLAANLAGLGFNAHQGQTASFLTGPTEGILISKLRFDQSRTEFERNVQVMVKNVEIAYWSLYDKYGQLYSFEENLRILQRAYQEAYNKKEAGGGDLKPYQFYQTEAQFNEFRGNRNTALQEVLDAERNLRYLIGLPMEDGERLIPITPPNLDEFVPDWDMCLQDTLNLRPELVLARDNLRYHQYLLEIQKNNLKPDFRFIARYEPVGFGNSLQGDGFFLDGTNTLRTSNALTSLRQTHFADYQLGFYLNVPLGQRHEHAAIRAARLQLAQSYYFLRDQEDKAVVFLAEQYQAVARWHRQIEYHRRERKSAGEGLNSYHNLIKGGQKGATYGSLEFLSLQRSYAAALVKEYNAISEYNNSLVRLEFAKGTTLRYNNVHISEGQLPACAEVSASQYEKERTRSLVLKQRPDALAQPGRWCASKEIDVPTLQLPPIQVIDANSPLIGDVRTPAGKSPLEPGAMDGTFSPKSNEITPVFAPSMPTPRPLPQIINESGPSLRPLPQIINEPAASPISRLFPKEQPAVTTGYVTFETDETPPAPSQAAREPLPPITLAPPAWLQR